MQCATHDQIGQTLGTREEGQPEAPIPARNRSRVRVPSHPASRSSARQRQSCAGRHQHREGDSVIAAPRCETAMDRRRSAAPAGGRAASPCSRLQRRPQERPAVHRTGSTPPRQASRSSPGSVSTEANINGIQWRLDDVGEPVVEPDVSLTRQHPAGDRDVTDLLWLGRARVPRHAIRTAIARRKATISIRRVIWRSCEPAPRFLRGPSPMVFSALTRMALLHKEPNRRAPHEHLIPQGHSPRLRVHDVRPGCRPGGQFRTQSHRSRTSRAPTRTGCGRPWA